MYSSVAENFSTLSQLFQHLIKFACIFCLFIPSLFYQENRVYHKMKVRSYNEVTWGIERVAVVF